MQRRASFVSAVVRSATPRCGLRLHVSWAASEWVIRDAFEPKSGRAGAAWLQPLQSRHPLSPSVDWLDRSRRRFVSPNNVVRGLGRASFSICAMLRLLVIERKRCRSGSGKPNPHSPFCKDRLNSLTTSSCRGEGKLLMCPASRNHHADARTNPSQEASVSLVFCLALALEYFEIPTPPHPLIS
jgi:hypothetical protein